LGSGGGEDGWGGGEESQLKRNLESILEGQKVKERARGSISNKERTRSKPTKERADGSVIGLPCVTQKITALTPKG
jgi:hypothetical protein